MLREILAHWIGEQRVIRQGLLALATGIGVTLVAGVILGSIESILEAQRGLLALVPAAIGMRGAVFGALGARLGTGMLTGQFTPSLRRTTFTGQNVQAALLLSVATAGLLAVLARLATLITGQESITVFALAIISMVGTLLSSAAVLAVVLALTRTAERRSWDMDAIGTPIISASADLTTIPALVVGALLVGNRLVEVALGALFLVAAVAAAAFGLRSRLTLVRRVVRESLPVLLYAATMGVLAGTVLEARLETLSQALLVAVPPFIASCGAIGGILSARLASQLHLGLIEPQPLPSRPAAMEGSLSLLFGGLAFSTVAVLTQVAALIAGFTTPGVVTLVATTLTGGLLAVGILILVAYYAATASYRFGLDPDNVSIPVVSSSMDFLGILCLVAGLTLTGSVT